MDEHALFAERVARVADGTSVEDQQMREVEPVRAWYDAHQILLDFDRIGVLRPAEASTEATNVRIDDEAFNDAKGVAQNHVGSLARHPRQTEQVGHRARHLASVHSENALAGGANISGLVAVKTRRVDILLKLARIGVREIFDAAVLLKELLRNDIHALVSTLRRELRGNQEFQGICEVKRAGRLWIEAAELDDNGVDLLGRTRLRSCIRWR